MAEDTHKITVELAAKLTGLAKGLNEASDQISGWLKGTREKMREFEKNAIAMGAAAASLGVALGVATKAFAEFEGKLNGIRAVSNTTKQQLDEIREKALQLGADTQFSASQAADGFFELGKAGFAVNEQMDAIEGTISLAAAAGIKIGEAAETSSGILRGFGLAAGEASNVADQLAQAANSSAVDVSDLSMSMKYIAPVARASNQSLSEMMGVLAVLGNNMIKGEMAGTTMRSAISSLQKPSKDAAVIMQDLGIATQDAQGKMLPFSEIVNNMRSRMASLTEMQRASNVATIFGESAMSGMLALINQAPGSIEKMIAAQDKATGAAKTMADTMNQGINFQIEQMKGSFETLGIQIGNDFAPALSKVIGLTTDLTNAVMAVPAPVRAATVAVVGLTAAVTALAAAIGAVSLALPTVKSGFALLATQAIWLKGAILANIGAIAAWTTILAPLILLFQGIQGEIEILKTDLDNATEAWNRYNAAAQTVVKDGGAAWRKYSQGVKLTADEARAATLYLRQLANEAGSPELAAKRRKQADEMQKLYDKLKSAPNPSGTTTNTTTTTKGSRVNTGATTTTIAADPNQAKIQAAQEALRIALLEADAYKEGDAKRTKALTDYIGKLKGIPGTYGLILQAMIDQNHIQDEINEKADKGKKEAERKKKEEEENTARAKRETAERVGSGIVSALTMVTEGNLGGLPDHLGQSIQSAATDGLVGAFSESKQVQDALASLGSAFTGPVGIAAAFGIGLVGAITGAFSQARKDAQQFQSYLADIRKRYEKSPSTQVGQVRKDMEDDSTLKGLREKLRNAESLAAYYGKSTDAGSKQNAEMQRAVVASTKKEIEAAEKQYGAALKLAEAADRIELKRTQYEEGIISPQQWIAALVKEIPPNMLMNPAMFEAWKTGTKEGIAWNKEYTEATKAADVEKNGGHVLTGDALARAQNGAGLLSDQKLLDILSSTFNAEKGDHGESWATTTEEGISLGQEIRNLADKIKDGMKDALGQFSQFNPLPVKDYSIQQLFAAGPQQRFFVESAGRVDVNLRIDGKVDKAAIMSLQNDPDVKGMFANMANQGNAAMRLVPGQ